MVPPEHTARKYQGGTPCAGLLTWEQEPQRSGLYPSSGGTFWKAFSMWLSEGPRGWDPVISSGASVGKHYGSLNPPKFPSVQTLLLLPEADFPNKFHPALLSRGESRLRQVPAVGLHLPLLPTLLCPPPSAVPAGGAYKPVRNPTFKKATVTKD